MSDTTGDAISTKAGLIKADLLFGGPVKENTRKDTVAGIVSTAKILVDLPLL